MLPPQSIDAEQSVLGGLLISNTAYDRIVDLIDERDFYRMDHRLIFKHIAHLIDSNKPADVLTLSHSLGPRLEDAGGQQYIGELALNTPGAANIRRHAEIVREASQKRAVIAMCMEASEAAYSRVTSASEILESLDASLMAFQHRKASSRLLSAVLPDVVQHIDEIYSREQKGVMGLPTGFVDLDRITSGLQPGDLILLAGRPSMGKTALGMNIVEHVAVDQEKAVGVFTLEMSDKQLTQRMLGSVGRLDQHELRNGTFPESDWSRVTDAVGKLDLTRIVLEETFDLSPASVRAKARKMKREHPDLGLVVVDYLQLMESGSDRRVDQIAEISRGLKRIAIELNVPVLALSQLSRKCEERPNHRPMMSDLRDSGALEQDADVILFIYRDEVYNTESEHKGIAELNVAKQRNGPTGMVYLTFLGRYTRFENYGGPAPVYRQPRGRVANFHDYKTAATGDE